MQPSPVEKQTDGQSQTAQNPAAALLKPRPERFCQFIASGYSAPNAYAKAFTGKRSRKSTREAASRLYASEEVRNRIAWLMHSRPVAAGQTPEDATPDNGPGNVSATFRNKRLTKTAQPVDGQPLNRELVRKMLLAALSSENPNSATVSAIRAAQDFIAQEQPADSKPGPETIADYLANGAPANTSEIPRIVSALCKAYQVTRQRFADLAHLSMDAQTCDTTTIMRHSDEIQPKSAGDLSSNNNDIGL